MWSIVKKIIEYTGCVECADLYVLIIEDIYKILPEPELDPIEILSVRKSIKIKWIGPLDNF